MSVDVWNQTTLRLERIVCCHQGCGLVFAVYEQWVTDRRRDHLWFYCPNGHHQHFSGKSDIEQAREEAERLRQRSERLREHAETLRSEVQSQRHKVIAERAAKTRFKNKLLRVHRGVCPECNRSFVNLKRHMECKHSGKEPSCSK